LVLTELRGSRYFCAHARDAHYSSVIARTNLPASHNPLFSSHQVAAITSKNKMITAVNEPKYKSA
jgi:hypothetical protein